MAGTRYDLSRLHRKYEYYGIGYKKSPQCWRAAREDAAETLRATALALQG